MYNIYDGFTFVTALSLNNPHGSNTVGSGRNDYTADFYGLKRGEAVNINKVIQYLKSPSGPQLIFQHYKTPTVSEYEVIGTDGVLEVERIITTPFEYVNEYKQKIKSELKCGINKKYDHIKKMPYASFLFSKEVQFRIVYFFRDTEQWRKQVVNTTSETDFYIDDQYIGLQFVSNKINDLYHLMKEIQDEKNAEWYKILTNKIFTEKFKGSKSTEELIFLYDHAADFTLASLDGEMLWKHICTFYKYDTIGAFSFVKDASKQLMRSLFAFNTPEKIEYLMQQLHKNQQFVKKIYDALDGTIYFNGKEQKCQTIFASILAGFCFADTSTLHFTNEIFYVGKDYYVNVKDMENNDREQDKYWIEQRHKNETYYVDSGTVMIEMGGEDVVQSKIKMNPLDIVTLLQKDTDSLLFVPVIFLKDIDHQKDIDHLMTTVRIGVDMLAIGLMVASLGSASPLLAVAGALEIGIAAADIAVMTNKDQLSEEFLKTWEKIYVIGGIATASPVVVSSLYKLGGRILASSAKQEMKNFVQSCMLKMILESEMSNFSKNTVKFFKNETEAVLASNGSLSSSTMKRLNEVGAIAVYGDVRIGNKAEQQIAIIYKGEIIAQANKYAFFNETYHSFMKYINTEKQLVKALDELLVYGKEYPVQTLKPLIHPNQVPYEFGTKGQYLVRDVDKAVDDILKNFSKQKIDEKVMVSGMRYMKDINGKYYTATNFLKEEIGKGNGAIYKKFIEELHPTLKARFKNHQFRIRSRNILAEELDILRAGWAGSHGEIRALDKLLKDIDPKGELGESIFKDIIGYNRFLREGAKTIQPPCVHCYYMTGGVKFIGF